MKNLLCLFAFENRGSRGPCLPPPPCAPCLKTPSSESLRFCTSTAPTYPGPIRGNPKLRPGTAASRLGKAEPQPPSPASATLCSATRIVALCCSVLHRVSPQMFQASRATPQRISHSSARYLARIVPREPLRMLLHPVYVAFVTAGLE